MEIIIDDKAYSLMQAFHIIKEEIDRKGKPKENSFGLLVNGKFVERLFTNQISPEEYVWNCRVWEVVESDLIGFSGKLVNPIEKKFVQTKNNKRQVFLCCLIDRAILKEPKSIPLKDQ